MLSSMSSPYILDVNPVSNIFVNVFFHSMVCLFGFGFSGGSDSKESACKAGHWIQSLGWKDPLGKGMATHSSILAWRIPWTEEPGGLPSMGSQRVGHD